MRVLVCGGRDFGDLASLKHDRTHPKWAQKEKEYLFIQAKLSELLLVEPTDDNMMGYPDDLPIIISGAARGADSAGVDWAVVNWLDFIEYPADWSLGKRAGYVRNKKMLEEGKPDLVIAFPGGRGTENMKSLAREAGVKVIEVAYSPDESESGHLQV